MDTEPVAPLPSREPRSPIVHWLVDSTIAFLVVAFVALLAGIPVWVVAGASIVLGALVAPFTRRLERRGLDGSTESGERAC